VDPCDPLVQQLVQDKSFLTAVQTSQLHAAASAAVRLMRAQGMAGSEFKRPPDRRAAPREPYADTQETTPRGGAVLSGRAAPGSLVVQRQVVEPRHREALRGMRVEVLGLEDVIPWNLVRRTWRTKVGCRLCLVALRLLQGAALLPVCVCGGAEGEGSGSAQKQAPGPWARRQSWQQQQQACMGGRLTRCSCLSPFALAR
jgi:hypothetical protein